MRQTRRLPAPAPATAMATSVLPAASVTAPVADSSGERTRAALGPPRQAHLPGRDADPSRAAAFSNAASCSTSSLISFSISVYSAKGV